MTRLLLGHQWFNKASLGLPVVGNALDLPKKWVWLKFHEYIQEYGPIVKLNIMGQTHILLGSEAVVDDLVRGRGGLYSSRPQPPAASILSQDLHMLMLPEGRQLQICRRFLAQLTTRSAASQYEPYQWLESYRMVGDLIATPSKAVEIFEHWSLAMGSRLLYGRAMPSYDGEQKEMIDCETTFEKVVTPGAFLVDILPWMRFLPDAVAPWKRWLKQMSQRDEAFYYKMWNRTQEDLDSGRDAPSWVRLCIEDLKEGGGRIGELTAHEAVHLMGVTYTAFGTTYANLLNLLLAIARHPEWWQRVQAEMDSVVGKDRLPTLKDLPQLPMLRAMLCEVTRVWPVTPAGVPHLLVKDDVYEGYHLPAGSVVHLVTWSCGRDPVRYPDPDTFNPDRWLNPKFPTYKEPLTEYPTLMNTLMFGAGRRQCLGMVVGARNVYIQTMMLAWACEFGRARDKMTGEEIIPPVYDMSTGFNVRPLPFEYTVKARSAERIAMVQKAYQGALAADPMAS
jgi:cytochrome P450